MNTRNQDPFEAIIVGGSYAGLAAALQLARARRRVLVVDGGQRRNRFATHTHGFLGHDGDEPHTLLETARAQYLAYPTAELMDTQVRSAAGSADHFLLQTADGQALQARRVILASGVRDLLPDIPGLAARWGRSVFHCPYCHGYELGAGPIALLASSPMAEHLAMLLPDWAPTTLLLNDAIELEADVRARLLSRGVALLAGRVTEVSEVATVTLADGSRHGFAGLFTTAQVVPSNDLWEQLGCELEDSPMGRTVRTTMMKETTVPGVFACGDLARPGGAVALSVGDGTMAGAATHRSLVFGLS